MNKSFNCMGQPNDPLNILNTAKQLALSPSKEMDPVFGTIPGLLIFRCLNVEIIIAIFMNS